jgi:hypothetical protein
MVQRYMRPSGMAVQSGLPASTTCLVELIDGITI